VWITEDFTRSNVYAPADHQPTDYPDLAMEVPATSEQVVRWQAAARAWAQAQAEMRDLYKAAEAVEVAVEQTMEEAERVLGAEADRDAAILHLMTEAEKDAQDGIREWVTVTRRAESQSNNLRHRPRARILGRTIHHAHCKTLGRVQEPSTVARPVRLPVAAAELATGRTYWDGDVKVHAQCAGAVRLAADLLCPARSPESDARCVLPNTREAHEAGHASGYVLSGRSVWATTPEDDVRWATTTEETR
jgi:hypothetical protein